MRTGRDTGAALSRVASVARSIIGNRSLRRVLLAYAAFGIAEWATWLAMLVYAYGRGGTTEAGLVAAIQLVPAACIAPLTSTFGDRFRPGRVLLAGYVAQAAAFATTATVLLLDGPAPLAYATATLGASAITITRPTMSALTPTLARSPDELTATNVAASWVESVSVLVAPALAGILLAVSSPGTVFAVMAAALAIAALLVVPVPGPPPAGALEQPESTRASLLGAVHVLRDERPARLLVILLCADFVALGALDVLYPELAIGTLGLPDSWAGYLNAAFGAGATLAIFVTAGLVGRARLVPSMLAGLVVYLISFVLLAAYPTPATAIALLATAGAGRVVLDVAARTLMQRVAPADTLARVFGLLEGLAMAGLAVGSLLVAALVAIGGPRVAIVGVGLLLPLAAVAAGKDLLSIDRHATVPVVEIGLLRSLPLFAPLGPATLELLAHSLQPLEAIPGTVLIEEGALHGDRFYVIASGTVEIIRGGVPVDRLGRGEGFGELALLHDAPRNATCVAVESCRLYTLDKATFLAAVTGHPRSRAEAARLTAARAGATSPAGSMSPEMEAPRVE